MATKKITDKSGVQSYDVGKADSLVLTGVKAGGGSDNIYLEGNSSDYTVSVSGDATKTVLLSNAVTGQTVSIALAAPAAGGGIGENIYFLDGGAWLSYKISATGEASVSLGKQAITDTPTALASSALTFSGNSSSHFQMYSLTVDAPSVTEGDDGTVALTYTLTLDKPTAAPLVINYWNAAGGTATANVDYVGKSTKITIPKGEQTAQVSFNVKGDTLVEPSETVNVKFNSPYLTSPVVATGTIVDNDSPTYTLTASADSVDEGGSVTYTLATTNVAAGTEVPYTITGTHAEDIVGGALTGKFVVGTTDSVTIAIVADNTTDGAETLRLALDNNGASAAVVINDTSLTPAPTYTLTQDATVVDEGGSVVYSLVTTNLPEGTEVPYAITGVQAEDVVGGSLTGTFTVGADGTATKTIRLKADSTTEGPEILKLALDGDLAVAADVTVNDTSVNTAPTITGAEASSGGVNTDIALANLVFADAEDNNLTVTVTATGGSVGGLTDADAAVDGIQLTGTAAEVTKAFADATFSGARVGTGHVTVVADDGAVDSAPVTLDVTLSPTYTLTPSATTVNEGKSVSYTLATDGVKSGTAIPYTITGIDAADLSKGSLTGEFVVGTTDKVTLTLKSDSTTEGTETIKFSLDGGLAASADVTVKDTSTAPPTYTLTTSAPSVDEGSSVTFDLVTTDVASGTALAYTIEGISVGDLAGKNPSLTGTFVVGADGKSSVTLNVKADKSTEPDPETIKLSVTDGKATVATADVTVNDTSLSPNTPPTITGDTAPVSGPVNTDIALADLVFADADNDNLTVTVTATGGTVGGLVDVDTVKDGIQLTGTAADVTTAFAAATFKGSAVGAGSVTVVANDGTVDSSPAVLDVTVVNSAPTITGAVPVSGDINSSIALPDLAFADADNNNLTVTVTATGGSVSGLTDADAAKDGIQLTGTAADVTTAFAAATFTGSAVGAANVTVVANDGIVDSAPASLDITLNPTYAVAPAATSVNEGASVTYTLTTAGVAEGTELPYTLSGVSAADVTGGSLAGSFKVGADGKATATVALVADSLTEGAETLKLALDNNKAMAADVTVNDTSMSAVIINAAGSSNAAAGDVAFTVEAGTYTHTISGYGTGDTITFPAGQTATLNNNDFSDGKVELQWASSGNVVTIVVDGLTQTQENQLFDLNGFTTLFSGPGGTPTPTATYALASSAASVDEGASVAYTLTTTNVAAGTVLPYTLSGVSAADVTGGTLAGSFTVGADGKATANVGLVADSLTEGAETLKLALDNNKASADVTVNDTSNAGGTPTPSTVNVSAAGAGDASAGNVTYVVASGTYAYSISGFGAGDVVDFPAGQAASLINNDFFDGKVDLQWAASGNVVTVTLTGLTSTQEFSLFSITDMNTLFGAGTII